MAWTDPDNLADGWTLDHLPPIDLKPVSLNQTLAKIARLDDATHRANLIAVRAFVQSVPCWRYYPHYVVPVSQGRIRLEWHLARRSLEIEFDMPTVAYVKTDEAGNDWPEGSFDRPDLDDLLGVIDWVYLDA